MSIYFHIMTEVCDFDFPRNFELLHELGRIHMGIRKVGYGYRVHLKDIFPSSLPVSERKNPTSITNRPLRESKIF